MLISLEDEQPLNLSVLTHTNMPVESRQPTDNSCTFKVQQVSRSCLVELPHVFLLGLSSRVPC